MALTEAATYNAAAMVDEPLVQVNVRLPESTVRACRRLAEQQGLSLPKWITQLMELEMVRSRASLQRKMEEEMRLAEQEQRRLNSRIELIEARLSAAKA